MCLPSHSSGAARKLRVHATFLKRDAVLELVCPRRSSEVARSCYLLRFLVRFQPFESPHALRTDAMYRSPTLTCPASAWLTIV